MLRFVGDGDQKKIHPKSPPSFNAKFQGKHEKNIHKILLEGRQSNKPLHVLFSIGGASYCRPLLRECPEQDAHRPGEWCAAYSLFRKVASRNLRTKYRFRKNPHAHKNKIATSTPPPPSKETTTPPPTPKEEFCGHGGFPAERTQKCQAPIKLAQPFPAPENFTDTRIFLKVSASPKKREPKKGEWLRNPFLEPFLQIFGSFFPIFSGPGR